MNLLNNQISKQKLGEIPNLLNWEHQSQLTHLQFFHNKGCPDVR